MIRARGVAKDYVLAGNPPRQLPVLRDLDLEVRDGEFVALLGPSGSGKSTLLGILAGLDPPSRGTVEVAGVRIDTMSEEELARFRGKHLGFVFQAYHLVPTLTAVENVMLPIELLGGPEPRQRAEKFLRGLGLGDRLDHLPNQLSGGEQQRVAIARALVNSPGVIFADEPTGNLDSANSGKILELLLELRGRSTLVMVTHDATLAARADRVLRLRDGALVHDGAAEARV